MHNQLRRIIALGILVAASAHGATNIIDFNTDPALVGLYKDIGDGEWRPSGGASGAANDGYLKITDARGGQATKLVFKDLEPGLVVKSFDFECDLRIGGGTARPADGFSLNFVSATDPMVINAEDGSATSTSDFSGTDNEGSLPEEGGRTGLGIGFDTWESATIVGVQDVVGISIRVDGVLIAQLPVPLQPGNVFRPGDPNPGANESYGGPEYIYNGIPFRNLGTNDANYAKSMQTGALNTTDDLNGDGVVDGGDAGTAQVDPTDPTWGLWIKNLKWEKFKASVSQDGKVSITWKGVELTPPGGLPTTFNPIPGRLVFGGRTGGAWEAHHLDNIPAGHDPGGFRAHRQRGWQSDWILDHSDRLGSSDRRYQHGCVEIGRCDRDANGTLEGCRNNHHQVRQSGIALDGRIKPQGQPENQRSARSAKQHTERGPVLYRAGLPDSAGAVCGDWCGHCPGGL